jgi:hypothetical protein
MDSGAGHNLIREGMIGMPEKEQYDMKSAAMLLAAFVRDGIESFHREHLTDEQMRALNPLIRNSIYTALYAMEHAAEDWRCDQLLESKRRAIPAYWESPELWASVACPPEYDEDAIRHFRRLHARNYGLPSED